MQLTFNGGRDLGLTQAVLLELVGLRIANDTDFPLLSTTTCGALVNDASERCTRTPCPGYVMCREHLGTICGDDADRPPLAPLLNWRPLPWDFTHFGIGGTDYVQIGNVLHVHGRVDNRQSWNGLQQHHVYKELPSDDHHWLVLRGSDFTDVGLLIVCLDVLQRHLVPGPRRER